MCMHVRRGSKQRAEGSSDPSVGMTKNRVELENHYTPSMPSVGCKAQNEQRAPQIQGKKSTSSQDWLELLHLHTHSLQDLELGRASVHTQLPSSARACAACTVLSSSIDHHALTDRLQAEPIKGIK